MVVFGKKGLARQNRAPRPGVAPGQVTPGVSPPAPGPVEVWSFSLNPHLAVPVWGCQESGGARRSEHTRLVAAGPALCFLCCTITSPRGTGSLH